MIQQIIPTSNNSVFDIWYFCWTDYTFLKSFIVSSIFPFIFIWFIAIKQFGIKDIEFIGYVSSSIHAVSVVSVSLIMIFNYSEKDLLEININDQNNIKIPFIFNLFRYLTIFQSSFFVIDSLQMLFLYHHKTWSYRIGMTLHHLFCLLCTCCIYYFEDPYIIYIYAYNTLLEISTCFLNLRYFAVQFKYENLYFYSGIGLLILYPSTRIAITIYCSYTAYYGVLHLIFGNSIVAVIVSTNAFILLLSAYYTKVLYSNPKRVYILKEIKKIE